MVVTIQFSGDNPNIVIDLYQPDGSEAGSFTVTQEAIENNTEAA